MFIGAWAGDSQTGNRVLIVVAGSTQDAVARGDKNDTRFLVPLSGEFFAPGEADSEGAQALAYALLMHRIGDEARVRPLVAEYAKRYVSQLPTADDWKIEQAEVESAILTIEADLFPPS